MRGGNIMKTFKIKPNAEALVLNEKYEPIANKKFTKAISLENEQFISANKCACCDNIVFFFNFENQKIQLGSEHIAIN
jgi:hypothetical protein